MRVVRDVDMAMLELEAEPAIGIDLETSGISPFRDRVAVITMYGERSDVAAVLHVRGRVPDRLLRWMERPGIEWIGHNIMSFDFPFLHSAGLNLWNGQTYFDTLIAATIATVNGRKNTKQKLDIVLHRELGVTIDKSIADHSKWMDPVLDENQMTYVLGDIVHLHALKRKLIEKIEKNRQGRALELEMSNIPTYMRMIVNGMPVSKPEFDEYVAKQHRLADLYKSRLFEVLPKVHIPATKKKPEEWVDVNLNSTYQLRTALEKIGIRLDSTKRESLQEYIYGSEYDSDDLNIEEIATTADFASMSDEEKQFYVIKLLLAFRTAEQRIKMYDSDKRGEGVWWQRFVTEGYVHATYWPVSTDTGRMSSSNPNFQQQPNDMRHVYGHVPGYKIVSVDYSQIEVYVMAIISGDKNMLDYLKSGDMHSRLAIEAMKLRMENGSVPTISEVKKLFPQKRKLAKAMTFALLFGGGYKRLYRYIRSQGVEVTLEEARELTFEFFRLFPKFFELRQRAITKAQNSALVPIRLPNGLMRTLVGEDLKYTTIMNTVVQGSAAAGLKNSIRLIREAGLDHRLSAAVHDELVFVVPEAEAEMYAERIPQLMVQGMVEMLAPTFPLTLEAGIKAEAGVGDTWTH